MPGLKQLLWIVGQHECALLRDEIVIWASQDIDPSFQTSLVRISVFWQSEVCPGQRQ